MKVTASLIIVGAGQGKRIKSKTPKPFIQIAGKPILVHTLEKFRNIPCLKERILVLRKENINWAISKFGATLAKLGVTKIVAGGKRRQDSVYNGLTCSNTNSNIIIIHDAVRPFVTKKIILSALNTAKKYGAAVTAIPAKDTIKLMGQNYTVKNTLNRQNLYQAQTPQAFRKDMLFGAYRKTIKSGFSATDDSQLVEMAGFPVRIVEGSEDNIKITTPIDVVIAEKLLNVN